MEEKYCLVKYCKFYEERYDQIKGKGPDIITKRCKLVDAEIEEISCPINLDKNGYYSEEEILKKGEEYRKL